MLTFTTKNILKNLNAQFFFEATADAMLLVNNAGRVVYANPAAITLFEYSSDEIFGLDVEALMPIKARSQHKRHRKIFSENPEKRTMGKGIALSALSRTGKNLMVNIGLSPLTIHEEKYVLVTFNDASELHAAELALRIIEERLRLAKQAAGFGVFEYEEQHKIVHWDEYMRELWGSDSVGTVPYKKFSAAIHPDDRASRRFAYVKACDPAGNGEYKVEFRVINAKNKTESWVSAVGKIYFEEGNAIRLIGIVQDITEQKNFAKTSQAQRAEIESFIKQQVAAHTASAIAHELNQPLAAISAYSEVALHSLKDAKKHPEKLTRALEGCVAQAQRAGASLHELLAFLQIGEIVVEPFNLNSLVVEAINIAKSDGYIEFFPILELDENIPMVLANRLQVQKVLVNLLRNAVEAMRLTGQAASAITVSVQTNQDMNMGHLIVRDSGPGISQEIANRIFEPFFTTKPTGIGMGLAISRALIEANGGQLWFETNKTFNEPDEEIGATFHFTLPFAK